MAGWDELDTGVFRKRYQHLDLEIGLVLGETGVVLIDTRASHVEARRLLADVGRLTTSPIRHVVDTHWHWDHTFGNAIFTDAEVWGHAECRRMLAERGEAARTEAIGWVPADRRGEIEEVEIRLPERIITDRGVIDLGNRSVELRFIGQGHTEGDIVVGVSDSAVVFAGDLLEEGAPPYFGDGYPIAWPDTVRRLADLGAAVVVPGHGDVMTPAMVERQIDELAAVALLARRSHVEGTPVDDVDVTAGPYPESTMREAVRRAYLELEASSSGVERRPPQVAPGAEHGETHRRPRE